MNSKRLKKLCFLGVIMLVMDILLLPAAVNAKKPVERPFKVHACGVFSLASFLVIQTGEGTHFGRFTSDDGQFYPDPNDPLSAIGGGTVITASGEVVDWIARFTITTPGFYPGIDEYEYVGIVEFTGGTGKFKNITGGFYMEGIDKLLDQDDPYTYNYCYEGEGSVIY